MISGPRWIIFGSVGVALAYAGAIYCLSNKSAPTLAAGGKVAVERNGKTEIGAMAARSADPAATDKRSVSYADLENASIDIIQRTLEPLARRADARASSELSRAAMRCYKSVSDIATLQSQMTTNAKRRDAAQPSDGDRDRDIRAKIDEIDDYMKSRCDVMSREDLGALARSAAKRAASLGDVDAQLCVIEQRFLEPRAPDLDPDERLNGRTYAADYEERALDRGDWRIVSLMIARPLSIGHGPIHARPDATPIDPVSYFRGIRLLRLGATGEYAATVDDEIDAFVKTSNPELVSQGQGLSDEDMADASAWAQQEYQSHFSTSPPLTERPVPCGNF